MKRILCLTAAALLTGCSTVGTVNQTIIDQAEPTVVHDSQGRAWLWLKGVVKMPRMQEFDKKTEPAATPSKPAA